MQIPHFAELLASLPRPDDPLGFVGTWREAAARHGLLPVYSDWACSYALTQAAEPVRNCDDMTEPTMWVPVVNAREHFIVLARAAMFLPELVHLCPVRNSDDPTCSSCAGTGRVSVRGVPTEMICECGGLGWYPAGTQLAKE